MPYIVLKYSMPYRLLFKTNHVSLSCISPADDILSNLEVESHLHPSVLYMSLCPLPIFSYKPPPTPTYPHPSPTPPKDSQLSCLSRTSRSRRRSYPLFISYSRRLPENGWLLLGRGTMHKFHAMIYASSGRTPYKSASSSSAPAKFIAFCWLARGDRDLDNSSAV